MAESDPAEPSELNQNLARNLRALMDERGWKQMDLAKKCGVAQTAISLYLDPSRRKPSASGKKPSATLAQVEMLAAAFGVEAWILLRPMNDAKLRAYAKLEEAAAELSAPPAPLRLVPTSERKRTTSEAGEP